MQAFEALQAAQREKEARQRNVQAKVDASRAANAQRKMAKTSRREWDFEKEGAPTKSAPTARSYARAETQAQEQQTTEDATAWDAQPDEAAWDVQPQADESAWGIASESPAPAPVSTLNGDAPRGRGKGRGRGQGRGRGERGEARGGGRGRGRDRDRKSAPVEHVDNNSWAQENNAGEDASAEWGISEPSWAIEKSAEPAATTTTTVETNEWEASAGDESAWGIAT